MSKDRGDLFQSSLLRPAATSYKTVSSSFNESRHSSISVSLYKTQIPKSRSKCFFVVFLEGCMISLRTESPKEEFLSTESEIYVDC